MTPEELDAYEDKLRRQAAPGPIGLAIYAVLVLGITALGSGLTWLFWDRLFR